jgi:hypothetical protein
LAITDQSALRHLQPLASVLFVVAAMTQCATCGADPCGNTGFCALCRKADAKKRQPQDPHIHLLRRLMEPGISLDRTYGEISRAARGRYNEAPKATYDAVVYELRTNGISQLGEPNCRRRLGDLSGAQMKAVMASLQALRDQYPKVNDELLKALACIYTEKVTGNE